MELNRKFLDALAPRRDCSRGRCAFSAGSKALRAGRYNGDAKAIVLCVAHNFHERQRVYFHFFTSIFTSFFTSESYIFNFFEPQMARKCAMN